MSRQNYYKHRTSRKKKAVNEYLILTLAEYSSDATLMIQSPDLGEESSPGLTVTPWFSFVIQPSIESIEPDPR